MNDPQKSNVCYRCKHFFITYEKSFPYGCRGFAMKSKRLPSLEVLRASQSECSLFAEKSIKQSASD
jgi:hypothetical protein